jgi:hypothetical protein
MNANVLRRWIVEAERADGSLVPLRSLADPPGPVPKAGFVALPIPPSAADATPITVEVRRSTMTLSVQWPRSAVQELSTTTFLDGDSAFGGQVS